MYTMEGMFLLVLLFVALPVVLLSMVYGVELWYRAKEYIHKGRPIKDNKIDPPASKRYMHIR